MLIDWLTLRTEINDIQDNDLMSLMPYFAISEQRNALTDEIIKSKLVIDIDAVRSDFEGMVWSISTNGKTKYLNIGASPAYLEHGRNIFGSNDYEHCKRVLITHAKSTLSKVLLFSSEWYPRRIDITQNFILQSHEQVKEALHVLRSCDGTRQKATTRADSVYWGAGSSYRQGKAYDKYSQSIYLNAKNERRSKPALYTDPELQLIKPIIRLEMSLGRQYFDEHTDESLLTTEFLIKQHNDFFAQFIHTGEVTDMDTLYKALIQTQQSNGLARSAYDTYLRIKQHGYEFTKLSMSSRTFYRHTKILKQAGLTQSDLTTAQIIPIKKRRIDLNPVDSWDELRRLHQLAA